MIAALLLSALAISVAGPPTNPEYLPLYVAHAEGYFADEQVDVTLQGARSEAPAAQALGRGTVPLAAASLDAAIALGHSSGEPPRLVFGFTAAPPVVLLVPAEQKSAIRSVGDLSGKVVGIAGPGTPAEHMLIALLGRGRVLPNRVSIRSFGERGVAGAVESGSVAAAMVEDPWASRLLEEGKAVALADFRRPADAARALGDPTVHAALFARAGSRLTPGELTPVCRALLRAVARIRSAAPADLEPRLPRAVVGTTDDFAVRLRGARESFLSDGWVTSGMLSDSLALIKARTPIPAKVDLPFWTSKLLWLEPLAEARRR